MTRSYLVTGGTGFLGSALVRRLVQEGYRVRVLDNQSRGSIRRLEGVAGEFELIEGDVRDLEVVHRAATGVDGICHLAFVNGTEFFYSMPDVVLDVGVKGMVNVLDACLKHHIGELVLASSSEVYQTPPTVPTDETVSLSIPDPLNPRYSYAAGKIISEIMALNYGIKHFERVVIFRPHNVYGPDMGWQHVLPQFVARMNQLCQANPSDEIDFPIQGSGQETRAFVFIDDFTDGLMLVIKHGQHRTIYNIGTSEELSIAEVARRVGDYFGRRIRVVPGAPATGGTPRRCPDIGRLRQFGYRPHFPFNQGLAKTAAWYVDHAMEAPTAMLSSER